MAKTNCPPSSPVRRVFMTKTNYLQLKPRLNGWGFCLIGKRAKNYTLK
jgi:hypothetical protein